MNARPQPFPFGSLPTISRAELHAAASLKAAATRFVDVSAVAKVLAELISEPVTIALQRTHVEGVEPREADAIAVAFSPSHETDGLRRALLVDVDGALAASLVARALRQRAPRVIDSSRATTPEVAGALAAVLHTTLRRAHAGLPLRVVAAGPAAMLARDLAAMHSNVATAWLSVTIGDEMFAARVTVPIDALPPRAALGFVPDAIASVRIAIPLVIATCSSDRATLAALAPGDAFVVPGVQLERTGTELTGPVALVPARGERGLAATLIDAGGREEGRLMLGSGPLASHPWERSREANGDAMSGETNATLELLEEAAVVVRIELGTVEMTAREWAGLAPGDVVTLGRKLGDPAILRVGGVELARGELVQVDGEYGVRILGRAGGRG